MKTKTGKSNKEPAAADLTDPRKDQEKLQPETATIDLPDVEDIPGQEYIKPPTLESFVDDTASSADEEGPVRKKGKASDDAETIFREEDEGLNDSTDSDDYNIRRAALDDTDDDGDPLNEGEGLDGNDLDIPGPEEEDDDEIGGEG